jgi:putative ABC transport system substrate-binding protein
VSQYPGIIRAVAYWSPVCAVLFSDMPADLPVEQRARFELHVNIAAARKLGLSVPESLLLRANRVIE